MPVLSHEQILDELKAHAKVATSADELMRTIVTVLRDNVAAYNWVGFYMIEKGSPGEEPMLVLGPYVGAETPHKRIPLNQGICGAAVSEGKTIIVDDVHADPRYLSCSLDTKSEIVAPIFVHGKIVGELDIDSHVAARFKPEDRELVEQCAKIVGEYLERKQG